MSPWSTIISKLYRKVFPFILEEKAMANMSTSQWRHMSFLRQRIWWTSEYRRYLQNLIHNSVYTWEKYDKDFPFTKKGINTFVFAVGLTVSLRLALEFSSTVRHSELPVLNVRHLNSTHFSAVRWCHSAVLEKRPLNFYLGSQCSMGRATEHHWLQQNCWWFYQKIFLSTSCT